MRIPIFTFLILLVASCTYIYAGDPEAEYLKSEIATLKKEIRRYKSKTPYIVIDTVHNRLHVWQQNQIVREAVCATGSGKVLLHPGEKSRWQFHTPLGRRTILKKVKDPIWAKPIWAFVETGEKPTTLPWEFRRLDQTTLGAYALELGDSYEIHGTLYPSLLGRNITHGCIRLNDDDLAFVHRTLQVGDQVYIY